jgi:hypothetical protein
MHQRRWVAHLDSHIQYLVLSSFLELAHSSAGSTSLYLKYNTSKQSKRNKQILVAAHWLYPSLIFPVRNPYQVLAQESVPSSLIELRHGLVTTHCRHPRWCSQFVTRLESKCCSHLELCPGSCRLRRVLGKSSLG